MNLRCDRTTRAPSAPRTVSGPRRSSGVPGLGWAVLGFLAILAATLAAGGAAAEQFKVVTAVPDRMSRGTTAFIDTLKGPRIVELDPSGKVIWQCSLAGSEFRSGEIYRGADLEWVGADDSFLVVVPKSGIFRLNRKCAVTWRYRTSKVSHDADLLPNGNVLFAFGWDSQADSQAVEIDPSGKVVWSWQAKGRVDPAWKNVPKARELEKLLAGRGSGGGEQFTHANSVARLPDGDTLVSLRNYHRVVRVAPDGSVKRVWGPIIRVHDPSLLPDGTLVAANHFPMRVVALGEGTRRAIFENEIGIKPIRTVQPLDGGNFLLTGGEDIVEIDSNGAVVWRVRIYSGLGRQLRKGVYKAVRIAK